MFYWKSKTKDFFLLQRSKKKGFTNKQKRVGGTK
jgi:hypothetical protein